MPAHGPHTPGKNPAAKSPHPSGPTISIRCSVPEGAIQVTFQATGLIEDEGHVEGTPLSVDEGRSTWIGYRMLRGRKGLLFLLVETRIVRRQREIARGSFEIVDGTGAYAGLRGAGSFKASAEAGGSLVEVFEGRLERRS